MGGLFLSLWALFFMVHANAAIFGADDRVDVVSSPAALQLSRATAIAVLSNNYRTNPDGTLSLKPGSLSDFLCKDEKFSNDPSLDYACTGFLIAPDLIVTAGHCMVNSGQSRDQIQTYCPIYSWLFDYAADANGQVTTDKIPAEKMYACEKVVYAIREEKAPFRDYAVVKLKRPVTDRKPLDLASGDVRVGDSVTMIGYPLGTPAKLSDHAQVLVNTSARQSFITNLDAFDGNSGSPVFNSKGQVAGILIGGTPEAAFKKDPIFQCRRYNVCNDSGTRCIQPDEDDAHTLPEFQMTGSIVQRIAPLKDFIETNLVEK